MKYPIGYWTVGQRVLWRKPGREKWVPMTIREIVLGRGEMPIAARIANGMDGDLPVPFDQFYDPIQCPATDDRLVHGAPCRFHLKKQVPVFNDLLEVVDWQDGWAN